MTIAEYQAQFEKDQIEKETAEQIIAATPLMNGVERITVELGDDHSGDPAMWLIFHLEAGLNADEPWLIRFNEFSGLLGQRMIDSGLTRFPYTRLRNAA